LASMGGVTRSCLVGPLPRVRAGGPALVMAGGRPPGLPSRRLAGPPMLSGKPFIPVD
jgi:hypothetical protein